MTKRPRPPNDELFFDPGNDSSGALERLLAPMSTQHFVENYWAKRPLHVKGRADKFRGFFDPERALRAMHRMVANTSARAPEIRAMFLTEDVAPGSATIMRIVPDQVSARLKAGATICASGIHEGDPNLRRFAEAIKAQLGYPGDVGLSCYWSPAGKGTAMHFDARVASTLQLEGSKHWKYSKQPAVEWPRSNADLWPDGTAQYVHEDRCTDAWEQIPPVAEDEFEEVLLKPGDLLVLPAGTWHSAMAGSSESFALNLAFEPMTFLDLLFEALAERLRAEAAWRAMAPCFGTSPTLNGLPEPVAEFIVSRIEEARRTLADLDPRGPEIERLWRRHVFGGVPRIL
jgi:hypothetical protein